MKATVHLIGLLLLILASALRAASSDQIPTGVAAADWSGIRAAYEAGRHRVQASEAGGHQARNPGQQWRTRFDGRGFLVQPDGAAWQWGLELTAYGYAGHERILSPATAPQVATDGSRVAYTWDAGLREWFVNDARGLEHGFTVEQRPDLESKVGRSVLAEPGSGTDAVSGSAGTLRPTSGGDVEISQVPAQIINPLTFQLAVRGTLRPVVEPGGRGVRFVDAQGASVVNYTGLKVWDADGKILPARFEIVRQPEQNPRAPGSRRGHETQPLPPDTQSLLTSPATENESEILNLVVDDRGARYPLTIDPIAQQAYLKASNTEASDAFGNSVAVSGDTVVVGAPGEDSNANEVNGDQNNNGAVNSGAAYVFVRSAGVWTQQAYLKASNAEANDGFGASVAVSGNTVVVGAPGEDSNGVNGNQSDNSADSSGAAYVFTRSGTSWTQQAYLKASNTGVVDFFGNSVAVSGDTVVIGAKSEDSSTTGVNSTPNESAIGSGAAYVFVRSGGVWTEQAYLKASNTGGGADFGDLGDEFGISVAVSGDIVVVGAYKEDSSATGVNGDEINNSVEDSGAAYIFVRNDSVWSQQAYLKASHAETEDFFNDGFGISVAVSGDTVVVGAVLEDRDATGVDRHVNFDSGAAYVFVRIGGIWSQQAYLKASNTGESDLFGASVAVSGDTVVVGAYAEDSDAIGVGGDQNNNIAPNSGAAYVFVRSGSTWSQQAYLKASNTGENDVFGWSVAVSGDTVVVGAIREDSNAVVVNGTQSNNDATDSGAAYVFAGLGPPGTPEIAVEQPAGNLLTDGLASLSFGSVNVGSSADLTFTVKNADTPGTLLLVGLGMTIDGANAADFTIFASPASEVFPGGSTTFTIRFTSTSTGAKSAALHIASNDVNENPFDIVLEANGINPSPNIVISEVYGGGGGGFFSQYQNDFIELFNRGTCPVNVNGWSVQYSFAPEDPWLVTELPDVTIPAGGYFLIEEGSSGPNGSPLPTPDATGQINLNEIIGKVALVNSTAALSGTCPNSASIVDLLGYGHNASCSETAPIGDLSNNTSAQRNDFGCTDTDDNSTDFTISGIINPQNSASPVSPCGVIPPMPEIDVRGGSPLVSIADGDTTPSAAEGTDFDSVRVNGGTVVRTFTIENNGSADLTVSSISKSGTAAADFTVSGISFPATIVATGSTEFTVTFNPSATGLRTAAITIVNNDCNEGSYDFAIQGTGVNVPPVAVADTLDRLNNTRVAKVHKSVLLANDTDADLDTLKITAVGNALQTGTGTATVELSEFFVVYIASANNSGGGSFEYTLSDGTATATGTVTVTEVSPPPSTSGPNGVTIEQSGANFIIRFIGVPGNQYRVQYTINSGENWNEFGPPAVYIAPTTDPIGVFSHTDIAPGDPIRLYRAVPHSTP